MLAEALIFLVQVVFGLLTVTLLLRFTCSGCVHRTAIRWLISSTR